MREPSAIHGLAWLAWLGAILCVTVTTRNPWYLGLALLWVALTEMGSKRQPLLGRSAPLWSPLRFGLWIIPLAAILNALTVHVGTTVLFRIPLSWPLLGGAVTAEALLFGALNGLSLTILFGAFAVVNRMLPLRAIIQLIPRAYYPVALVAAIAITFVPVTLQQWQQIREAQAIRGHQLRGIRSALALWLPLMTGGMERALQLAEAMTARGFAGGSVERSAGEQVALIGALVTVIAGLCCYTIWGQWLLGLFLMAAGAALFLWLLRAAGRQHPHTRYRPMPWQAQDLVVCGGALVTALAFLLPIPGHETLAYNPYPTITMPPFAFTLGMATWGILAPAALWLLATPPPHRQG